MSNDAKVGVRGRATQVLMIGCALLLFVLGLWLLIEPKRAGGAETSDNVVAGRAYSVLAAGANRQ